LFPMKQKPPRLDRSLVYLLCFSGLSLPSLGQTPVTAEDYSRAEKFMPYNTNPLVFRAYVRPEWTDDDHFSYRVTTPGGTEKVTLDAVAGTRQSLPDKGKPGETRPGAGHNTVLSPDKTKEAFIRDYN